MATQFNGTTIAFGEVTLELVSATVGGGDVPRVDATTTTAAYRQYLGGIKDALTVDVTYYNTQITPGTTGAITGFGVSTGITWRCESSEYSGDIDGVVTYSSTFVQVSGS